MTSQIQIEATDACINADDQVIDDGLGAFNEAAADFSAIKPLRCYARDANGALVGGIIARLWGACGEVQILWVRDGDRRKGVASRLMARLEEAAYERGCRLMYLETFSFQAPRFYEHIGYETATRFEGFPDGVAKYIMHKTLKDADRD